MTPSADPPEPPAAASEAPSEAPSKAASVAPASESFLGRLGDLIDSRRGADPSSSYVARLLSAGEDAILKKIGEEATETVMAAKDGLPGRIVSETADLWFHCMVMLAHYGLRPEEVVAELQRREGLSGLDEKALRGKQD
jgi:phosphoribosyl-ATP pyrophosphohydrolase